MEGYIGHIGGLSSSSDDDDSAPPVIMPPPPSRQIINDDEIIDLDGIGEHHRRRRRNNRHRRQMRHTGHAAIIEAEHGIGGIIDMVTREAAALAIDRPALAIDRPALAIDRPALTIDRAAEEDAAVAAAAAFGNYDLNTVRTYKDMFNYTTNLSGGMPMNFNQEIGAYPFTEEVSIIY